MKKSQLNKLKKYESKIIDLREDLEILLEEMQDDYDSKSERWQESEKGEELQGQISTLENIVNAIHDAECDIEELTDCENEE